MNDKGLVIVPTNSYKKWTNGIVPYVIDAGTYDIGQLTVIDSAMRLLENRSIGASGRECIKFVPRTNQATYLRIHAGSGCWSYVGMQQAGGAQLLSLQKAACVGCGHCVWKGTVAHELLHALGFYHEQSRFDRDNYVKILFENIQAGTENNFNKYALNVANYSTDYDFRSIMHYEWFELFIKSYPKHYYNYY